MFGTKNIAHKMTSFMTQYQVVEGHLNPRLFNPNLQPRTFQPQTFQPFPSTLETYTVLTHQRIPLLLSKIALSCWIYLRSCQSKPKYLFRFQNTELLYLFKGVNGFHFCAVKVIIEKRKKCTIVLVCVSSDSDQSFRYQAL